MEFIEIGEGGSYGYQSRKSHPNDVSFAVEGNLAPGLTVDLRPGQGIVANMRHVLLYEEPVSIRSWSSLGGHNRLLVNTSSRQTARVLLGCGAAGHLGAFELERFANRLLVPQTGLIAAGPGLTTKIYTRYRSISGGPGEECYSLLSLEGGGWAFVAARGNAVARKLRPGETACVRAHAIAALTATVDLDPLAENELAANEAGLARLRLAGPGTVWLQTVPAEVAGHHSASAVMPADRTLGLKAGEHPARH